MTHTHRWIIKPPDGPESLGRCWCGSRRMFPNSTDFQGHPYRNWTVGSPGSRKRKDDEYVRLVEIESLTGEVPSW